MMWGGGGGERESLTFVCIFSLVDDIFYAHHVCIISFVFVF